MSKLYRIIDANYNRIAEGLRVLEDLSRFYLNEEVITEKLKKLRHTLRKSLAAWQEKLLFSRDAENDFGLTISQKNCLDKKDSLAQLITANFKRVQEGLRSMEECWKVLGKDDISKIYESCRYQAYSLEKDYFFFFAQYLQREKLRSNIYCLTAEEYSRGRSNIEVVQEMLAAGVEIIQYREKEKKMLLQYKECMKLREMTKEAEALFLINDHIHLALAVEADGVHIGQDDLPLARVRDIVGEKMLVGLSTHSPEQAQAAVVDGADYIGVGPIFSTKTKKDVCSPVGLGYLDYVVKNIAIPFVAIGGIKEHNLEQVLAVGARTIAMVTEIVGAEDIKEKISKMRRKIDEICNSDGSC